MSSGLQALHRPRIAILGAGNIGCFLGTLLLDLGCPVLFYGRPRLQRQIAEHGLTAVREDGRTVQLSPTRITYTTDPEEVSGWRPRYLLIASKGVVTEDIVRRVLSPDGRNLLISSHIGDGSERAADKDNDQRGEDRQPVVVSLQNGIHNADTIRNVLPPNSLPVLAGMVPFNVASDISKPVFRQGTIGAIYIEESPKARDLVSALRDADVHTETSPDMRPSPGLPDPQLQGVLYGKLLFNLNNSVNAMSGHSLKAELSQYSYRKVLAGLISEALATYKAAGIRPLSFVALPPSFLPYVFRLPDFMFVRVAASMLRVNEKATSSMQEDLVHKRETEVELINGEISRLGKEFNVATPLNDAMVRLVKEVAEQKTGPPNLSGEQLYKALIGSSPSAL